LILRDTGKAGWRRENRSMEGTDGNGYPTPANPTGARIKWGKVWLKIRPTGLLIREKSYPPGLAEAGMEVPNPYPLTRIPDNDSRPHMSVQRKP
jgi:hypothetical protein